MLKVLSKMLSGISSFFHPLYSFSVPIMLAFLGLVEAISGWSGNKPGFDSGIVMSVQSTMSDCATKHSGMQSMPL